jgi:hypothetical protein
VLRARDKYIEENEEGSTLVITEDFLDQLCNKWLVIPVDLREALLELEGASFHAFVAALRSGGTPDEECHPLCYHYKKLCKHDDEVEDRIRKMVTALEGRSRGVVETLDDCPVSSSSSGSDSGGNGSSGNDSGGNGSDSDSRRNGTTDADASCGTSAHSRRHHNYLIAVLLMYMGEAVTLYFIHPTYGLSMLTESESVVFAYKALSLFHRGLDILVEMQLAIGSSLVKSIVDRVQNAINTHISRGAIASEGINTYSTHCMLLVKPLLPFLTSD